MKYTFTLLIICSLFMSSCDTDETNDMEVDSMEITDDDNTDTDNGTDDEDDAGSGDDETAKLPTRITVDGTNVLNFFYNDDDSLDKIVRSGDTDFPGTQQFYYENQILVRTEYFDTNGNSENSGINYTAENGRIIQAQDYFDTDVIDETYLFSYENDNVVGIDYIGFNNAEITLEIDIEFDANENAMLRTFDFTDHQDQDFTEDYTYDNRNSPFKNMITRIPLILDFFSFNNNITQKVETNLATGNTITTTYSYTYDDEGFPTSQQFGNTLYEYEYNR